jgi:hypothetical protein
MDTGSYKYTGGDKPLTLRGGRGEFYGGNQVRITEMNSIQTEKNKYKPFQGEGLCIGNIINETPKEKTRTGISLAAAVASAEESSGPAAKLTRAEKRETLRRYYAHIEPGRTDAEIDKTLVVYTSEDQWAELLIKIESKYRVPVALWRHGDSARAPDTFKYSNSNESYGKIKSLKKDRRYQLYRSLLS